jgi:hypothetical protein
MALNFKYMALNLEGMYLNFKYTALNLAGMAVGLAGTAVSLKGATVRFAGMALNLAGNPPCSCYGKIFRVIITIVTAAFSGGLASDKIIQFIFTRAAPW